MEGFSADEELMIRRSDAMLRQAGYDTSIVQELVRADLPASYRAMTLDNGAALGDAAFDSQGLLNHVLEEELLHLQQKAAGQAVEFEPGTAKALEEEVNAKRRFHFPTQ